MDRWKDACETAAKLTRNMDLDRLSFLPLPEWFHATVVRMLEDMAPGDHAFLPKCGHQLLKTVIILGQAAREAVETKNENLPFHLQPEVVSSAVLTHRLAFAMLLEGQGSPIDDLHEWVTTMGSDEQADAAVTILLSLCGDDDEQRNEHAVGNARQRGSEGPTRH